MHFSFGNGQAQTADNLLIFDGNVQILNDQLIHNLCRKHTPNSSLSRTVFALLRPVDCIGEIRGDLVAGRDSL